MGYNQNVMDFLANYAKLRGLFFEFDHVEDVAWEFVDPNSSFNTKYILKPIIIRTRYKFWNEVEGTTRGISGVINWGGVTKKNAYDFASGIADNVSEHFSKRRAYIPRDAHLDFVKYCTSDVADTTLLCSKIGYKPYASFNMKMPRKPLPEIENVIFNDPATIVFWTDGSKTVVKAQDDDIFDPEKGLAMAIAKNAFGNKRDYYNVFLKWLKKYEKEEKLALDCFPPTFKEACERASEAIKKMGRTMNKTIEID